MGFENDDVFHSPQKELAPTRHSRKHWEDSKGTAEIDQGKLPSEEF
jgi:hypothetical protein